MVHIFLASTAIIINQLEIIKGVHVDGRVIFLSVVC
jgi:hypothetical protein